MNKSAYILQLESKDVIDNTLEIKNKRRYSASFDYSLDFIQLQKINNTVFYYDNDKLSSDVIISVKFTYSSHNYTITSSVNLESWSSISRISLGFILIVDSIADNDNATYDSSDAKSNFLLATSIPHKLHFIISS